MSASPLDQPMLAALLAYWQAKCQGRLLPERRDIDPLEMAPALLPHLTLCDLFDRGTRARFRLVGTFVVKRLGFDPTGRYLDHEKGGFFDLATALHRLVYCERAPVHSTSVFVWGSDRRLEVQQLLLPLAQGGPDPAIALAATICRSTEPFPPTIRALGAASHRETQRGVLKSRSAPDWDRSAGRNVA
ncbi:MAG TPA: PAS domain-containing protein [Stellaceae bacterium]|nr:PAS domain-containing protein [Stellaceae bacterium]